MTTGHILGVIALVCASVWLLWRMVTYRNPTSDNRSEHFPVDEEDRG